MLLSPSFYTASDSVLCIANPAVGVRPPLLVPPFKRGDSSQARELYSCLPGSESVSGCSRQMEIWPVSCKNSDISCCVKEKTFPIEL